MKKIISTLLLAISAFLCADAQTVYIVKGKDIKPSAIIGTFHLASGSYAANSNAMKQAFEMAEQVYGEVITEHMTHRDTLMWLQGKMMMDGGKTLKTVLSEEQFNKLNTHLTKMMGVGLDNPIVMQQMGAMKPAALTQQMQILGYLAAHPGEFDPTNTIDLYFQTQAKANNMPVGGLETVAFQTEMMFGMPLDRQITQLMCLVDNPEYYNDLMERMAKAYFAQDINGLKDIMDESLSTTCDATPEEKARLITDRNKRWVTLMPAIMKDRATLFVVGAGHLPGEEGVLQLLRKAGYEVTAVTDK